VIIQTFLNSDLFDLDLDQKDSEMLRRVGNSLNSTLEGIVKRFNNDEVDGPQWVFIDGIVDPFRGRGYCTSVEERLFVTASSSLVTQGDTEGTAHPNNKGHAIIGQVVHEHLLEHLVDTRPSAPVPPENPEAGAPRRRQAPRPIDPEARQ